MKAATQGPQSGLCFGDLRPPVEGYCAMTRILSGLLAFTTGLIGLQFAGAQPPNPAVLFKLGDGNKDGKLSFDEFRALVSRNAKLKDNPELVKRLFERLDTNRDQHLTPDEFKGIADLVGKQKGGKKKADPPTRSTPAGVGFNDKPTQEQIAFFEKKIRPVLVDQCYKCHSAEAEKLKGELLLDTRDGVRKGGENRRDHRARQPRAQPAHPGAAPQEPRHRDAAEGEAAGRCHRRLRGLGEDGRARPARRQSRRNREQVWSRHREGPLVLGVRGAEAAPGAGNPKCEIRNPK